MNKFPLARKSNLVIQESGDELLIYDLKIDKAFCLNGTSRIIWQLCNGKNSVLEISKKLGKKLNASISRDFVWLALDQLNRENLLENRNDVKQHFSDLSRREVIREVGFASVIALPMVISIVAPKAMMAQSVSSPGTLNSPCVTGPGSCVSGLFCTDTRDSVAGGSPTPAGTRCCTSSNSGLFTAGSTFCTSLSCFALGGVCCSGGAFATLPATSCNPGENLCVCNL